MMDELSALKAALKATPEPRTPRIDQPYTSD
jgi:hypothetical protein